MAISQLRELECGEVSQQRSEWELQLAPTILLSETNGLYQWHMFSRKLEGNRLKSKSSYALDVPFLQLVQSWRLHKLLEQKCHLGRSPCGHCTRWLQIWHLLDECFGSISGWLDHLWLGSLSSLGTTWMWDENLLQQHEFFLASTVLLSAQGSGELELLTKWLCPCILGLAKPPMSWDVEPISSGVRQTWAE